MAVVNWLLATANAAASLIGGKKVDRKAVKDLLGQLPSAEYNKIVDILNGVRATWRGTKAPESEGGTEYWWLGYGRNSDTGAAADPNPTGVDDYVYFDENGVAYQVINGGTPAKLSKSRVVIASCIVGGLSAGTYYMLPGGTNPPATGTEFQMRAPITGTVRNLRVRSHTAIGSGDSVVWSVRKNASATGSIDATQGSASQTAQNTSTTFAVTAGTDTISVQLVKTGTAGSGSGYVVTFEIEE